MSGRSPAARGVFLPPVMTFTHWLLFATTSALIILTPGQTVLFVISRTLARGRRGVARMALGVMLGNAVAMTICFAGLGALLVASERAFLVLRWAGAAYLVYLALRLWRLAPRPVAAAGAPAPDEERLVTQTFFLMLLNPNALTFFIALAPQFLDQAAPLVPQLVAMLATFVLLSGVNIVFYVYLADALRSRIAQPRALRWLNRVAALSLIGIGVFAVAGASGG